jgi:uncharacterized membrane protein YdbT with pleckstrin-like domain
MLEFDKKHKRGKKTFIFLFIKYGWWLALIGIGFIYLTTIIYFGSLRPWTENFLASHAEWYISVPMLSEWLLLLGISFIFIAYLRANVVYRNYKFIIDEYALHLHRGLFFIRETTIPYRQISNVHIGRPYHYRLLGLAQLDIVTAAQRNMDERAESERKKYLIPVIDMVIARKLSRILLEGSAKSRRRDREDEDEEELEDDEADDDSENEDIKNTE